MSATRVASYIKNLDKQIDIDKSYSQAVSARANLNEQDQPTPFDIDQEDEMIKDSDINIKLFDLLKRNLKPSDANIMAEHIRKQGKNTVKLFIRFYSKFASSIGEGRITIMQFKSAWDRFLNRLEKSDFTGVETPLTEDALSTISNISNPSSLGSNMIDLKRLNSVIKEYINIVTGAVNIDDIFNEISSSSNPNAWKGKNYEGLNMTANKSLKSSGDRVKTAREAANITRIYLWNKYGSMFPYVDMYTSSDVTTEELDIKFSSINKLIFPYDKNRQFNRNRTKIMESKNPGSHCIFEPFSNADVRNWLEVYYGNMMAEILSANKGIFDKITQTPIFANVQDVTEEKGPSLIGEEYTLRSPILSSPVSSVSSSPRRSIDEGPTILEVKSPVSVSPEEMADFKDRVESFRAGLQAERRDYDAFKNKLYAFKQYLSSLPAGFKDEKMTLENIYYAVPTDGIQPVIDSLDASYNFLTSVDPEERRDAIDSILKGMTSAGSGMNKLKLRIAGRKTVVNRQRKGMGLETLYVDEDKPIIVEKHKKERKINENIVRHRTYIPFGKYHVHEPKLLQENKFSFYILNGRDNKIQNRVISKVFRRREVSDTFKEMFLKLLHDQVFDDELFDKLSDIEKDYFDYVIRYSKLSYGENKALCSIYSKTKPMVDKDIKRFELIRGELLAGNNNAELIKELKVLLYKLYEKKLIPPSQYREIMQMLLIVT